MRSANRWDGTAESDMLPDKGVHERDIRSDAGGNPRERPRDSGPFEDSFHHLPSAGLRAPQITCPRSNVTLA